jgi:hypothetical protein
MAGADRPFRSALPVFLLAVSLIFLTACATGGPQPPPRIDRLPESAGSPPLSQVVPSLGKDQLVSMARAGATPEDVVESWRRDGARLRLRAADIVDLDRRSVSLPILDALLEAQEQALRTDLESRLAARQAEFSAQLAAERARLPNCPNPAYWGYGGWGWPGTWRGGIYRGW